MLSMKVNRYGRAEILTPQQISLLFTEGFVNPRDRSLFGVCLYAAARINEACTLFFADAIRVKGVREKLVIRSFNTKNKQETREIDIHPKLREYLEQVQHKQPSLSKYNPYLFPGRHGRSHIHKASADRLLQDACGILVRNSKSKGLVPTAFGATL